MEIFFQLPSLEKLCLTFLQKILIYDYFLMARVIHLFSAPSLPDTEFDISCCSFQGGSNKQFPSSCLGCEQFGK